MLRVVGEPSLVAPAVLPGQRVLRVRLHNAGGAAVEVSRTGVRLLDAGGRDLRALCTPSRLHIGAGEEAPLDLVYRARPGAGEPAALEIAGRALPLGAPTSARRA